MAQPHVVHMLIDVGPLVPTAATLQAMRDGREGKNMTPVTLDELRARVEGRQANAEDHSPP